MDIDIIWSGVLTFVLAFLAWLLRNFVEEQKRLDILINRTREQLAKDYISKDEFNHDLTRVMDRLDALDAKIDRLIEAR